MENSEVLIQTCLFFYILVIGLDMAKERCAYLELVLTNPWSCLIWISFPMPWSCNSFLESFLERILCKIFIIFQNSAPRSLKMSFSRRYIIHLVVTFTFLIPSYIPHIQRARILNHLVIEYFLFFFFFPQVCLLLSKTKCDKCKNSSILRLNLNYQFAK